MKIHQIMQTNVDKTRLNNQLHQDTDIQALAFNSSYAGKTYEVTDNQGQKVGEINGNKLSFLILSRELYQNEQILNAMDEGIIVIDKTGRICFENEAYSRILGVPMRKTIGRNLHEIEKGALLLKTLATGKPIKKERQLIQSVQKYVSMHTYPIYQDQQIAGAFSIFKDVTELNHLNQEVKRITQVANELGSQITAQKALDKLEFISRDPHYLNLVDQAGIVAKTDATVLIRGENGVGKELFAKFIHQHSNRRHQPLITVNCAAIPETLIESELFGYEEGAFTGSKKGGKLGKFELAQGGTLFLDEIGDMPLLMQTKLLRVLQNGEIEKIGRSQNIPMDVRILTATNQPLEAMIRQKLFRQDLYYRLNVVSFHIPPLRSRITDIVLLTNLFLKRFNTKYKKNVVFNPQVYGALEQYPWPGNVRELENCIESNIIMCTEELLQTIHIAGETENIPEDGDISLQPFQAPGSLKEEMHRFEKLLIQQTLSYYKGDLEKTLQHLDISRRSFYRKLKES